MRNLAAGCRTFTEIRQGAPGIPKALLADRLATLERHGVVARIRVPSGRGYRYELTECGLELKRVCDAMGEWGARWLEIEPSHIDPAYVLWATCRLVDLNQVPPSGAVVRFDLRDDPNRRFWILMQHPRAELCSSYPGRPEDLVVTTDSHTLIEWNLRRVTFDEAIRAGRCQVDGPPPLARALSSWLRPSPFAYIERARTADHEPAAVDSSESRWQKTLPTR